MGEGGLSEHTENADLFWALRGGGAGPWGIITAMTIKVHKPRNSCETGCYSQSMMIWKSNFNIDDGKMMEDVDGVYGFMIFEALYVGKEEDEGDYWSLEEAMA